MASASPSHPSTRSARLGLPAALSLVVGLALVGAACTGGESDADTAPTTAPPTTAATTTTTADPGPSPIEGISLRLEPVIPTGLADPVAMVQRPGRNQFWIAERAGTLRVATLDRTRASSTVEAKETGVSLLPGTVLDLRSITGTDGEGGLLGLAFSTDGSTLFVSHTDREGDVVVAAYRVDDVRAYAGPGTPPPVSAVVTVDPGSRNVLLNVEHRASPNHNGGQLVLGPDGYLYVGVGDGGVPGDPEGNAQSKESLLGTILRIDPAGATLDRRYAIPPDNPFATGGGRPEIHLYGVRDPWRFSFDRDTGSLWVADVGHGGIEEIDRLPATDGAGRGANLGWNWFEGEQRVNQTGTPPRGLVEPLRTYDRADGRCSIVGGFVYRGAKLPKAMQEGVYVYGDRCSGQVWGLYQRDGEVVDDRPLGATLPPNTLASFAQDENGELYVVSSAGSVSRIIP